MRFPHVIACLLAQLMSVTAMAQETSGVTIKANEWQAYRDAFVEPSGRVVDDANGGISHSEGQGYGMLLAYLAGSPADFETIWTFTRNELQLRDDGLIAWKWDPGATPHVSDVNNASDGDILVAYALGLAAVAWSRPDAAAAATELAEAVARTVLVEKEGRLLLLPGVDGFDEEARDDAPVVNPSYWIFEAMPMMAALYPAADWARLGDDGVGLVEEMRFGDRQLPAEWISLATRARFADAMPERFGYNNLRIPLYLVRAGNRDAEVLARLRDGMTSDEGAVEIVDLANGSVVETVADPGYRAIPALVDCAVSGTRLPDDIRTFAPTNYYPSTLHLLALDYVRRELPQCL
jgi:endoglucanase